MSSNNFLLLTAIILLYCNSKTLINAEETKSDLTLDLTCSNDDDCISVFRAGKINSSCVNEVCVCFDKRSSTVPCKPVVKKIKNHIGDPCPCNVENSKCDPQNNTCVCDNEYVSSVDRKNCWAVVRNYTVTGECDEDTMCVKRHGNSYCDIKANTCLCKANHTMHEQLCAPDHDLTEQCEKDEDCTIHRNHTICMSATKMCTCKTGYISVNSTSACLPISTYDNKCSNSVDCEMASGRGVCENGKCVCDSNYYVHEIKGAGIRCIKKVFVGDSCIMNSGCFEANRYHQVMECLNGECVCLPKYIKSNENRCESNTSGTTICRANLTLLIGLLNLIFIYGINVYSN